MVRQRTLNASSESSQWVQFPPCSPHFEFFKESLLLLIPKIKRSTLIGRSTNNLIWVGCIEAECTRFLISDTTPWVQIPPYPPLLTKTNREKENESKHQAINECKKR
jgi:hypothetical protein